MSRTILVFALAALMLLAAAAMNCTTTSHVIATSNPPATSANGAERMLGDFEDGTVQKWDGTGSDKVALSVSDQHATSGKKSLKVDLPAGQYPGVGLEFKAKQDFSPYQAIRASVFVQGGGCKMCVRVDDWDSKGFGGRYNGDEPYVYKLNPGMNEVEVTMAALKQGSFMARGLDVDRIRQLRFFCPGLGKDTTLYIDNVRLVSPKAATADTMLVASFDKDADAKFTANDGAKATVVPAPIVGSGAEKVLESTRGKALKVELTPEGGEYPGLNFKPLKSDWLGYDVLTLDIFCPKDTPSPRAISMKIVDTTNRKQMITIPLQRGANSIRLPLEIVAGVSLGKVAEVNLYTPAPSITETVFIQSIKVERFASVEFRTVRDSSIKQDASAKEFDGLTIDCSKLAVPRNTCFQANVFIPLQGGKTRIVRCNSAWANMKERGQTIYAIPAAALEGCDKSKPIEAFVFVSDHDVWSFWTQSAKYEGKPLTLTFVGGFGT